MNKFVKNVANSGRYRVYEMATDSNIIEKVLSMDAVNYYTRDYKTLLERIDSSLRNLQSIRKVVSDIVLSEEENSSN